MANIVYTEAKYKLGLGQLDLSSDTLKAILVTAAYNVDPNHKFVDEGTLVSPANFEAAGTGYIGGFGKTGRREILNKLVVFDSDTSKVRLFGDNLLWTSLNVGVVGGVIIIREGVSSDSDSLLIGYTNEGGFPVPTDGGELQIRFHANGILAF